jgi:hypothetical protein
MDNAAAPRYAPRINPGGHAFGVENRGRLVTP